MPYSIGEFSKLSGYSAQMIRYYEKQNILKNTRRNDTNNYREYSTEDLLPLLHMQCRRGLGYSIKELSETLLPSAYDSEPESWKQMQIEIEQQIELLKLKRERILLMQQHMLHGEHGKVCSYLSYHDTLYLFYLSDYHGNIPRSISLRIQQWLSHSPFPHVFVHISKNDFLTRTQGSYDVRFGLGVIKRFADNLRLDTSKPVQTFPSNRILGMAISTFDPLQITTEDLSLLREQVAGKEDTLVSDLICPINYICKKDGKYYYNILVHIDIL